jgi:hypothetical protein
MKGPSLFLLICFIVSQVACTPRPPRRAREPSQASPAEIDELENSINDFFKYVKEVDPEITLVQYACLVNDDLGDSHTPLLDPTLKRLFFTPKSGYNSKAGKDFRETFIKQAKCIAAKPREEQEEIAKDFLERATRQKGQLTEFQQKYMTGRNDNGKDMEALKIRRERYITAQMELKLHSEAAGAERKAEGIRGEAGRVDQQAQADLGVFGNLKDEI